MVNLTPAAHRHFAAHHGIASVDDLRSCGLSAPAIKRLQSSGSLELVLHGAYRNPSVPFDELARCAAVCTAHPEVAIAGPTAGRLWGFRRMPRDHRIHVLAPPASHPTQRPWVAVYRTDAIHEEDVIERDDGIRLTSRARTALDLTRWLDPLSLRSVIEQAMSDGHLADDHMRRVAVDWLSPGRPWIRRYLEQLDRRVTGPAAESHPEVVLGEALAAAGVRGLVRQFEIDLPDYGRARFDLAVPELRWAIEVDVHPTHREAVGIASDHQRDVAADRLGWLVNRVTAREVGPSLAATVDRLNGVYRDRVRHRDEM